MFKHICDRLEDMQLILPTSCVQVVHHNPTRIPRPKQTGEIFSTHEKNQGHFTHHPPARAFARGQSQLNPSKPRLDASLTTRIGKLKHVQPTSIPPPPPPAKKMPAPDIVHGLPTDDTSKKRRDKYHYKQCATARGTKKETHHRHSIDTPQMTLRSPVVPRCTVDIHACHRSTKPTAIPHACNSDDARDSLFFLR